MYCEFYGFREKPFNITPNPRFIFLSKNHREAFAHLLYGIDNHSGFIELTGEVGTGKTTVLRTLLEQLDERGHRTALIFNPCLSALELMRSINREFGVSWEGLNSSELVEALNRFLLDENTAGRTVVLVIDEAQNLETQVLEQVRLISNLETKTDKLIQIVLAGQPELAELLNRSELRQISQRITVSYHLAPLDFEDTRTYIEHRLEVAGDWRAASFTPQALQRVFRHSGGTPRLINVVCDRALLFGYIEESREISGRMVNAAIAEIKRENGSRIFLRPRKSWLALAAILCVAGFVAMKHVSSRKPLHHPATTENTATGTQTAESPVVLAEYVARTGETESAVNAFNAIANLWNVEPVSLQPPVRLEEAAAQRGLKLTRFSGSLGYLVRIGYPAILEFRIPGVEGKRYVALTGVEGEKLLVAPPLGGRNSLSSAELDTLWSGIAFVPWKNFYNIPSTLELAAKKMDASSLQQLLHDARLLDLTGKVSDRDMAAAIKKFQAASGLMPDGKAGAQTLLLLYRAAGKSVPTLVRQEGNQQI